MRFNCTCYCLACTEPLYLLCFQCEKDVISRVKMDKFILLPHTGYFTEISLQLIMIPIGKNAVLQTCLIRNPLSSLIVYTFSIRPPLARC